MLFVQFSSVAKKVNCERIITKFLKWTNTQKMITTASGGDALNNSVTQIFVVERRVVGVVVGDVQYME